MQPAARGRPTQPARPCSSGSYRKWQVPHKCLLLLMAVLAFLAADAANAAATSTGAGIITTRAAQQEQQHQQEPSLQLLWHRQARRALLARHSKTPPPVLPFAREPQEQQPPLGGGSNSRTTSSSSSSGSSGSDTSTAPGSDVRLQLGPYLFNPSVVEYKGLHLATARTAYMKSVGGRWWWFNAGHICRGADAAFSSAACSRLEPWQRPYRECLWSGLVDTRGIEDPKLFVWPGRGVYAVFGRKPEGPEGSVHATACPKNQPWLQLYLYTVLTEQQANDAARDSLLLPQHAPKLTAGSGADDSSRGDSSSSGSGSGSGSSGSSGSSSRAASDPWLLTEPVPLRVDIPGFYSQQLAAKQPIKEKNWMPFVHEDRLYMVHSIQPHRVLEIQPNGSVGVQHVTENRQLMAQFAGEDIHGGPPVMFVPPYDGGREGDANSSSSESSIDGSGGSNSSTSESSRPGGYYLGIMHYFKWEKNDKRDVKYYYHYAYKMQAHPPFALCAISNQVPLVFFKPRHQLSWPSHARPAAHQSPGKQTLKPHERFRHQRIWRDSSHTAFINGLHVDAEARTVRMSYGSGDIESRQLTLSFQELEGLFTAPSSC